MVLPQVVGYKLTGEVDQMTTSTDVVLTITKVKCSNKMADDTTWWECPHETKIR